MSKLYNEYQNLKRIDSTKTYIFKSGIFYIALDEDAKTLSNKFGFKLVNLNDTVLKCGFPEKRLSFYVDMLRNLDIDFEIIDLKYDKIENYSDYLNNNKLKEIIDKLISIDMNNIAYKDSFELLLDINKDLKKIYSIANYEEE